jgi:tetratricopeptide (TPR) repeat protein
MLQNGFVFFFVLAIAAKSLLSERSAGEAKASAGISGGLIRVGFSAAILCCCLLAAWSVVRIIGGWYGYGIASAASMDDASSSFNRSIAFDDQNASVYAVYGLYFFEARKFAEAVPQFRKTIDLGRATTADYSYLASAQTLAGDVAGAEKSLAEAVRVYPLSIFARTRYAAVLKEAGKSSESDEQFKIARNIDQRQAETWRTLIEEGGAAASKKSFENKLPVVMDLRPRNGIYAVMAEREIRHPEEKSDFHF